MISSTNLTPVWHHGETPAECAKLREEVFIDEQGFPYDKDEDDARCYHLGVLLNGETVGVSRMFWENETTLHCGRIAVKKELRGQHIGQFIISCMEAKGKELGAKCLELGAQMHAVTFYEGCGFEPFGEVFDDAGAPHRHMRKVL